MTYIGSRVPRREDHDLLTGRAVTVADLREPGTVEVAFARSPVAHGRLRGVRVSAAREVTGVVGAWSAADLPDLPALPAPPDGTRREAALDRPALARGIVRYAGEPIAVVAAERRAQAEDGVERIDIEVDPLPPLTDAAQALDDDAPWLFPDRDRRPGDGHANLAREEDFGEPADDVFAGAPVVVEAEYRQQLLLPTSLEARAVLVRPETGGGLTVWASHQAQHRLRAALAETFGLEPDEVRVVVPSVGGAFGAKSQTYPEYVVVAYLARLLDRPVRWVEDRNEAMLAATRGRGQRQRARLAADTDGTFLAYELKIDAGVGAYPHSGAFVPTMTAAMSGGPYRTPRVHAHLRSVLTTTAPTAAYRGAGRPEAAYAIERTVDLMARRLGMDPAELRRRNLLRPDQFPYRTPTGRLYDSGDYARALDLALDVAGYADVRAEQARRRAEGGPPLGIGMAVYVERSGGAPDTDEYGSVEVCADGTVVARCGSTPTGQGHLTSFAQVVASALGLGIERVRVIEGDTREVPYGVGSFGSRSMQVGGGALWRSAESLIAEARERFADIWGIDVSHVDYHEGTLIAGEWSTTLEDLVGRTGPLRTEERFRPPQAFPFGAYVAVVEIDPELGTVGVRRLVAVDDYGVVVNPMIVEGQGQGSIAQGLGQVLYEDALHGADGTPFARTLLDYLLPTAADMPPLTLEETRTPNPNGPFGAKGAGEAGCIGTPPAVVNAVCDALDVDHIDMPLTPEAVWRAMTGATA